MSDKNAWFDVKVYMTKGEWDSSAPSQVVAAFDEIADAIEEAKLWPEAYQVVVVARSDDHTHETGESVFALKDIT